MNEKPNSGRPLELTDKQMDELLQAPTDGAPLLSIVEGDEWPPTEVSSEDLKKTTSFDSDTIVHALSRQNDGLTS